MVPIRVGANRMAAHAEIRLTSSFCARLASVNVRISSFCRCPTSATVTVSAFCSNSRNASPAFHHPATPRRFPADRADQAVRCPLTYTALSISVTASPRFPTSSTLGAQRAVCVAAPGRSAVGPITPEQPDPARAVRRTSIFGLRAFPPAPAFSRGPVGLLPPGSPALVPFFWGLLSVQSWLPWANDTPNMPAAQGFNTAVSFVTNTNWQSYSGESALGYTVQAIGLTVQNFLSAAVGIAVVAALIRGLTRRHTDRLGNFWVDLTRLTLRLLLPLSFLAALVLVISGVIQNLNPPTDVATLAGNTQTLPGGLVASQEAIKELGTNGGGYLNANSAHPFENPTRSPTCSRSSCCWPSRSRCPARSARWSATPSRATRSSPRWWCCGPGR